MIHDRHHGRLSSIAGTAFLVLTGCIFFPSFPGTVGDVATNGDSNLAAPNVEGLTRVELINRTEFPAICQVQMTLDNNPIHEAQRRVRPNGTSVVEGPDNADRVSVSATLDGLDGFSQGPLDFVLGADYQSGETIRFVIELPTPELGVAVGLEQDLAVEAGTLVDVPVSFDGADDQTTFSLFADPDSTPASGNEIPIVTDAPATGTDNVTWNTSGIAPGAYSIYAEAQSGERFARSATAAGKVTILPALAIAVSGLDEDVVVESGDDVAFAVETGGAVSGTPTFSAFAQRIDDPNAGPIAIVQDLPAAAQTDVIWHTITAEEQVVPPGTYRIFATLTDGERMRTSAPTAGNVVILPSLAVQVLQPSEDLTVESGEPVEISVDASGTDENGFVTILATELDNPDNTGDFVIADNLPPAEAASVLWDTSKIASGTFEIRARLTDVTNNRSLDSAPAAGRVTVIPPLAVSIVGLDEDVSIEPYSSVDFSVLTSGTVDPNATISVFAVSQDANDPNYIIKIASGVPAMPLTPITWNLGLTETGSGVYRVYATVQDGQRSERSALSGGRVIVLAPLSIDIVSLHQDVSVAPDATVLIDVATSGVLDPNASFSLWVNAPEEPNVAIAERAPAAALTQVEWDTSKFSFDTYTVSARLRDRLRGSAFVTAPGHVTISSPPTLTLTDPNGPLELVRGSAITLGWIAFDREEDATISFYLDPDTTFNGNEFLLVDGISEDAEPVGTREANSAVAPGGEYNVVGVIDDGFSQRVTYGQTVCSSEQLFGVFSPSDLEEGEITEIRGLTFDDPNRVTPLVSNVALGYAVDLSRDITGDGAAELVVGDPLALRENQEPFEYGAAYYHQQLGPWPRDLTVDDLHNRAIGPDFEGKFGASVALTAPTGSSSYGEVLVGAPLRDSGKSSLDGAAYYIDGDRIVFNPGDIDFDPNAGVVTSVNATPFSREQLGVVAALGDVDDDTYPDSALGSPSYAAGRGRVVLISGDQGLPNGTVSDIGDTINGAIWEGADPNDQAGFAISSAALFNADTYADLLVGAPGRLSDAGCVYLVYGDAEAMDGSTHQLDTEAAVRLDGEAPGDRAGSSVSLAYVNDDALPDIVIGAPGANGGAGRVYLVYGDLNLPAIVSLGDVGVTIAGAVFDGDSASRLGTAVSGAGDFNNDGFGDLLLGAPGYNDDKGAAHLVYGSDELFGNTPLASSCGAPGVMYIGDDYGDQFGAAVSGGASANGDEYGDIAIGAPGANRAYVIFGVSYSGPIITCLADIDDDGDVDITDLGTLLQDFGMTGEALATDLNNDGSVDIGDLGILLSEYGQFCQ